MKCKHGQIYFRVKTLGQNFEYINQFSKCKQTIHIIMYMEGTERYILVFPKRILYLKLVRGKIHRKAWGLRELTLNMVMKI